MSYINCLKQYFNKQVTISPLGRNVIRCGIAGLGAGVAYGCSPIFYSKAAVTTKVYNYALDFPSSDKDTYYAFTVVQENIQSDTNDPFNIFTNGFDMLSLLRASTKKEVPDVKEPPKAPLKMKVTSEGFDLDQDTIYVHLRSLQFPKESIEELMQEQKEKQQKYDISELLTELLKRHPEQVVYEGSNKYKIYGHNTKVTRCIPADFVKTFRDRKETDVEGNKVVVSGTGTEISKVKVTTKLNTSAVIERSDIIAREKRKRWMSTAIFGVATFAAFSRVVKRSPLFTGSIMRQNIPITLVMDTRSLPIYTALIATPVWTVYNFYAGSFTDYWYNRHSVDTSPYKRIESFFRRIYHQEEKITLTLKTITKEYDGNSKIFVKDENSAFPKTELLNAVASSLAMIVFSPFITVPVTVCFSTVAGLVLFVVP